MVFCGFSIATKKFPKPYCVKVSLHYEYYAQWSHKSDDKTISINIPMKLSHVIDL